MNYTPQGGAIKGNAADDTLMVDQGFLSIDTQHPVPYTMSTSDLYQISTWRLYRIIDCDLTGIAEKDSFLWRIVSFCVNAFMSDQISAQRNIFLINAFSGGP